MVADPLLGSLPLTPGGIGIVEVSLTGFLVGFGGATRRSWRRAALPLPDYRADARARRDARRDVSPANERRHPGGMMTHHYTTADSRLSSSCSQRRLFILPSPGN